MANGHKGEVPMNDDARLVLKLISELLDYPGRLGFWDRVSEHADLAGELDARLKVVYDEFRQHKTIELEKVYVATFDFNPKASLYITGHELGDSRDRGQALIELTALYRRAGYEVSDDQLADFLPQLLEFIAVRPDLGNALLLKRIARAAQRIRDHLGTDNLYRPLFDLILRTLEYPVKPVDSGRDEHPDLDNLPYPVEYR